MTAAEREGGGEVTISRDNDGNRECGSIVSAPLRRVGPQRVLCVQYTTVCYAANNTQVNNARWVQPYNVIVKVEGGVGTCPCGVPVVSIHIMIITECF